MIWRYSAPRSPCCATHRIESRAGLNRTAWSTGSSTTTVVAYWKTHKENARIAAYFSDWQEDPILAAAYTEALEWGRNFWPGQQGY